MTSRTRRRAGITTLSVALAGVLLTGSACTSDPGPRPTASSTASSTASPMASPTASPTSDGSGTATALTADREVPLAEDGSVSLTVPALDVTGGSERDRSCFVERDSDLGVMDFYLDAAVDIESLRMELIDPRGVRLVGRPVLVPAVNRGGSIPYGGTVDWDDRAEVLGEQKFIEWSARQSTRFASISGGDSYLVLMRLRPTADRVSFDGLRVDYEVMTPDDTERVGPQFTAEVPTDTRWRIVERFGAC
ncbi:hypothetical protein KLP28_16740 [Nocardioidaceae bacterium]|nr:hypothetical protein KLP28_16740 [Nocardioidaceae bacterium]